MYAPTLLLLLSITSTHATRTEETAEAHRLTVEMNKLAQRDAWAGVERAYQKRMALERVEVPVDTHLLGAAAARQRGDIVETWRRLHRALEVDPLHEDAMYQLGRIEAFYGEVTLKVTRRKANDAALLGIDLGFSPEYRQVFEYAQQALDTDRHYHGLLPLGRYQLGDRSFEIIGGPPVQVTLR